MYPISCSQSSLVGKWMGPTTWAKVLYANSSLLTSATFYSPSWKATQHSSKDSEFYGNKIIVYLVTTDLFCWWKPTGSSWTQFERRCSRPIKDVQEWRSGNLLGGSIFISWHNTIWHVTFWHKNSQWLPTAKRTKSKVFGMANRLLWNLIIA